MVNIKELLKNFQLNLKLSPSILNLNIEGEYVKLEKDKLLFHSDNHAGFNKYNCYVFKGGNDILMIVPNNKLEMVVYRKKLNDRYIGYSYDKNGHLSFRT